MAGVSARNGASERISSSGRTPMDRVSSQAGRRIGRCGTGDIRLSEVISALPYPLDVTEGQPMGHAVRSCAIGMRIGEEIGLDDEGRPALVFGLVAQEA